MPDMLCSLSLSGWHVPTRKGGAMQCACGYLPTRAELRKLELAQERFLRQEYRDRIKAGLPL